MHNDHDIDTILSNGGKIKKKEDKQMLTVQ